MAQLYFHYASMNAGKSSSLLQSAYNYTERGMKVLILKPSIDTRDSATEVVSRIGIRAPAITFGDSADVFEIVHNRSFGLPLSERWKPDAVFVDEAQFLTRDQVYQLASLVDSQEIPVLCYGLRTDFQGNLFEGSAALMAIADKLVEMKGICHCGKKATMVLRLDKNGYVVRDGAQIEIGAEDKYVSVCRKHFTFGAAKKI